MGRKEERQIAFQLIYEMMIHNEENQEYFMNYVEEYDLTPKTNPYTFLLLNTYLDNQTLVKEKIKQNLDQWKMDRVAKVDMALLKIAVTEILFLDDIPNTVSINEAVSLAKKFSGEKSHQFINGVLRKIFDSLQKSL